LVVSKPASSAAQGPDALAAAQAKADAVVAALARSPVPPDSDDGVPAFDIARIEPTGEAVIAGRATPGATVELRRNESRNLHCALQSPASPSFSGPDSTPWPPLLLLATPAAWPRSSETLMRFRTVIALHDFRYQFRSRLQTLTELLKISMRKNAPSAHELQNTFKNHVRVADYFQ
jgi:hypothetical protein